MSVVIWPGFVLAAGHTATFGTAIGGSNWPGNVLVEPQPVTPASAKLTWTIPSVVRVTTGGNYQFNYSVTNTSASAVTLNLQLSQS